MHLGIIHRGRVSSRHVTWNIAVIVRCLPAQLSRPRSETPTAKRVPRRFEDGGGVYLAVHAPVRIGWIDVNDLLIDVMDLAVSDTVRHPLIHKRVAVALLLLRKLKPTRPSIVVVNARLRVAI